MEYKEFMQTHPDVPLNAFSGYFEVSALDHIKQCDVILGAFNNEEDAISFAMFHGRVCVGLTIYVTYRQYIVN